MARRFELTHLGDNVGTTVNRHCLKALFVLGKLPQLLRDLLAKLSCRRQHQSLHMSLRCVQMVQQRQAKRRRLASPCLGQTYEVTPTFQQHGDGLGLNVRRGLKAQLLDGLKQRGRKAEGVERCQGGRDSAAKVV